MCIPLFSEMPSPNTYAPSLSNNTSRLDTRHYLAFLFIAIFGTYYYIIVHGDFINLDDMALMTRLLNESPLDLKALFFPQKVINYYRPMVELSYRLDHFLWFDSASFWHLTNVVLHAVNTGLVYLIARILLADHTVDREAVAFCSALLYGINPLATESVCWVSGRSELILAFFMLSSFSLYLLFKGNRSYLYLLLSGLLYLCAAVTKETALSLPLLLIAFEFIFKQEISREKKKKYIIAACYFFLLTAVYFLFFRQSGVNIALMNVGVGSSGLRKVPLSENILISLASVGFYVKKIFIPWPLNFAVYSLPLILYASLGLVVLVLFVMRARFLPPAFRFFAAWVLITITPAVAAAVLHIAWVPWGERYLYVPLAGFSIALGLEFVLFKMRHPVAAVIGIALIAGLFWATTLQRTYVWADEVELWDETAQKSDYGPVHYHYGETLLYRDRKTEGIEQMKKAIAKGFSYYPYLTLADQALANGDFEGSEQWLKKAIHDFPLSAEPHRHLASNYLLRVSGTAEDRLFLMKAINEYLEYVAVQKKDAAAYLRIAQLYRAAHQKQRAVPFLKKVIEIDNTSPAARIAMKYLQENAKSEKAP